MPAARASTAVALIVAGATTPMHLRNCRYLQRAWSAEVGSHDHVLSTSLNRRRHTCCCGHRHHAHLSGLPQERVSVTTGRYGQSGVLVFPRCVSWFDRASIFLLTSPISNQLTPTMQSEGQRGSLQLLLSIAVSLLCAGCAQPLGGPINGLGRRVFVRQYEVTKPLWTIRVLRAVAVAI